MSSTGAGGAGGGACCVSVIQAGRLSTPRPAPFGGGGGGGASTIGGAAALATPPMPATPAATAWDEGLCPAWVGFFLVAGGLGLI